MPRTAWARQPPVSPMKSQRFGTARRVRRRSEFQQVFKAGSRVQGRFFTLIMAPNRVGTTRLGIVASRKIGDSVRRNRAKRLIREIFRTNILQGRPPAADLVVIPRRELFDAGSESSGGFPVCVQALHRTSNTSCPLIPAPHRPLLTGFRRCSRSRWGV